jgi:phage shock protein A
MGWYDSIIEDLGRLKDLVVELGESAVDTVTGSEDAPAVDRKVVDDCIRHLATRAAPRQWAEPARDAIQATKSWLDTNASSPDYAEVTAIHTALIEGEASFQAMRDWKQIIQRLWNTEEDCMPRPEDSVEQLHERRSMVDTLERRLERRWEDSIEDRKIIVAFRPRIQKPTGAFEGLFDQMNRNQKMIAETLASLGEYRAKIDAAIPTAQAAETQRERDAEAREQESADLGEMDDVHKCVTDGGLQDTSEQLADMVFTTWFESNGKRFYAKAKEGAKVSIPVTEFDCGDPNFYPGIERDGAIKATGKISAVERQMGPMFDPGSAGLVSIEFSFTSYFTAKSQNFKMSSIYEFTRGMAVNCDEGEIIEGNHDFLRGFARSGGDSEPVRR